MHKMVVVIGLTLLILPGLFMLTMGRRNSTTDSVTDGESRSRLLMILPFVPGIMRARIPNGKENTR